MQTVLSIDISASPAEAVLANIDGNSVEVIERHSLEIDATLDSFFQDGPQLTENTTNDSASELPSTPAEPAPNPIATLLAKVRSPWSNAILTVSTNEYLALNLDLPFGDNKNINRILDLEVQDLVPFEIEDFHLSHKTLAPIDTNGAGSTRFDVHVGIISKGYIQKVMDLCHKANFEPAIVTTPCAVAGAVFNLAPSYFAENSVVILERLPFYYVITSFNGNLRSERILLHPSFTSRPADDSPSVTLSEGNHLILLDLKLFLSGCEKRYEDKCEKVYFFGKGLSHKELQNALARDVEVLQIEEFLQVADENSKVAVLASIYAEENNTALIINNFRARAYAYNQKIKYLFQSLYRLLPVLLVFLACFSLFIAAKYLINKYSISRLHTAINAQIAKVLPEMEIPAGEELKILQAENQKLEEQLKDISSLSSLTPLDLLLEISKDLPNSLGVTIKSVKIKDNKITIDGLAKAYTDIDNVGKILEKKPLYQRVKRAETSGISAFPGLRPFSYEIWVKE